MTLVKTVFTRNVGPVTIKTILNTNIVGRGGVSYINDDLYKRLADFTILLNTLLVLFSEGKFSQVALILTNTEYASLATQLINLKQNDPVYEQLRFTIARSLEGLYQGVLQYIVLINTQYKLIKETERASILDDMKKLMEYLKKMKESLCILPDSEITVVKVSIKPEYAEYIKLYGYPEGGVFEIDKLAYILADFK